MGDDDSERVTAAEQAQWYTRLWDAAEPRLRARDDELWQHIESSAQRFTRQPQVTVGDAVTIELTQEEADALYFWTQSGACDDYWTGPLLPVGKALARWWREGASVPWSNR